MSDYNQNIADKMISQGKTVVLVRIKQPEPSIPQLELMMTGSG
jgi:hypothetical protein